MLFSIFIFQPIFETQWTQKSKLCPNFRPKISNVSIPIQDIPEYPAVTNSRENFAKEKSIAVRPRSHYPVFVQKRREKPPFLRKCSHWSAQKRHKNGGFPKRCQKWISTKTEVFENPFDQCELTKTEVFENAPISNNELHKNGVMWTHKNGSFSLRFCYQADQCERTKTEVFLSVFVQKQSSVNR